MLKFSYAAISDVIAACPPCQVIQNCWDVHYIVNNPDNPTGQIPIYPPDRYNEVDFAKCVCSTANVNNYKQCVPCSFNFKKTGTIKAEAVEKKCQEFNINGTTNKNKDPVPANPTITDPASPTNTNGSNNTSSVIDNGNTGNIGNSGNTGNTGNNNGDEDIPETSNNAEDSSNNNVSSKKSKNSDDDDNGKGKGGSKVLVFSIIGIVAAAGVIGFFVYKNKKKERPESMPFYGNAASPNKYPSLDLETKNTMSYISSIDYNNPNQTQNYQSNYQSNYDYTQNSQQPYDTNQYPSSYDYENVPSTVNGDATVYASSTEPSYDVRRESKNQFINPLPSDNYNPNASIYTCTYQYDPKLDDELELKLNDQIQIIEEYEDGWMKAINLTTKKEGMAPIVCVKPTN